MKTTKVICTLLACFGVTQSHSALASGTGGSSEAGNQTIALDVSAPNCRWLVESGAGALVSNVRTAHEDGYTLVPVELTLSRSFDKVYLGDFLGGIFQGSPEALFRGHHTVIVHGIESRLDGVNFGLRYNFTKPGGRAIPFAETTVGFAFADSRGISVNGQDRGLGQDFNFNFTVASGLRYDLNERWYVRLATVYSHYSNAGLSEPERKNRQIDGVGAVLSVGCRF